MFMVALFSVVTLPIINTFSRTLEAQADQYSLETENRPDALSSSLVKRRILLSPAQQDRGNHLL